MIVYNIEPFCAGIRQDDWKLNWRTRLPAALELYTLANDPAEIHNVAVQHPDKVAALQLRAHELAPTRARPILLETELQAMRRPMRRRRAMPPSLPAELESHHGEN